MSEKAPVAPSAPIPLGPAFAQPEQSMADLSSEIVQALPRGAGERITCRRITTNHYRCNWWAPQDTEKYDNPNMSGMIVTTHRVHKSQFLRVTKSATGLDIKLMSGG
jgi:hypothetical protein